MPSARHRRWQLASIEANMSERGVDDGGAAATGEGVHVAGADPTETGRLAHAVAQLEWGRVLQNLGRGHAAATETGAAGAIPAGVENLSEDGTLRFEGKDKVNEDASALVPGANDFDAVKLEKLVGEYGSVVKAVELG